jgi:hypothetical protein
MYKMKQSLKEYPSKNTQTHMTHTATISSPLGGAGGSNPPLLFHRTGEIKHYEKEK